MRVKNYDEALRAANDTSFGLSSGICTTSLKYASDFRRNAEAGMVMVNLPTAGVDYHVPFGGRKGSSYGPKEQGKYAVEFGEYLPVVGRRHADKHITKVLGGRPQQTGTNGVLGTGPRLAPEGVPARPPQLAPVAGRRLTLRASASPYPGGSFLAARARTAART